MTALEVLAILLIRRREDIDSAGIGREHGPTIEPEPFKMSSFDDDDLVIPRTRESRRNTVTLSGLLNAIDGNASQEGDSSILFFYIDRTDSITGRLLIMTSNNPDVLDAALTRPGRIDKKVYFGNMSKSAGKSIFKRLIGRSALAHDAEFTMEQIEEFADEFTEKVPANTFTPAQVQNFLQGCRGDPHKAIANIEAWVKETREEMAKTSPAQTKKTVVVEKRIVVDPAQSPLDSEKFNLV